MPRTSCVDHLRDDPCRLVAIRVASIMALNIRKEEAERLARALATLTGESKTEAVIRALRDRLARVRSERTRRRLADDLDDIALHCAQLPKRDARAADEIPGCDEYGVPR